MNTLFSASTIPAGSSRRIYANKCGACKKMFKYWAQFECAHRKRTYGIRCTSMKMASCAKIEADEGERSDGKSTTKPVALFLLSLSKHLIHCHLQTAIFTLEIFVLHVLWSSFSTYPFTRANYLFFACSISMRRVAWGAFPCMCLKYRKSSPRCAIDLF